MDDTAVIINPSTRHSSSIIWLHGLGANGHDFEPVVPELGLPDNHGIKFIFPHAPNRSITINGGMQMRAWYDVRDVDLTQQEDESSIIASTKLVYKFIEDEINSGISANKILLAGFSQGGAISLYGGLKYTECLAGILALSTYLPLASKILAPKELIQTEIPIMMMHGTFDPVIPVYQGNHSRELLVNAGCTVGWNEYPMQHAVCPQQIRDTGNWIKEILLA